jgi:hypothetical protein
MKNEEDPHEKPEKRDVVDDISPKSKPDDEKTEEKQLYEESEKKDVVTDINSEGKYDDNNLVEGDREHLTKGDGFEDTEVMKDEDTEETRDEDSNDEEEKTVGKQPYEQQAETDLGEHLAKGDELEDASEDTIKIVEKETVEQDEAFPHWEDVKEERSREEEAEEKFDDDDRGEYNREFINKEEGFEDTTADTDEEDIVKEDEALFNREDVPEARTESPRKSNGQHSKTWRLKELMLMLILLLLHRGGRGNEEEQLKINPWRWHAQHRV